MKTSTWLGAVVILGIIVVLLGCGSKDPAPSAPPLPPAPGAGPMRPPTPTAVAEEKPKTEAKPEDDSDDPWFGEKKTVTGAVGKALLRGFTHRGGSAPKKDELPVFIK